ncbi:MAG: hypothetical protein FJ095_05475 [Deltaproteobacteria bacterium]|nr:hypothetical protein [Deltaproteobacteria bacterium]
MTIKHSILAGLAGLVAGLAVVGSASEASAQEIQITGPLAGAKAVRRLRLHRDRRFDIAPHATFTLLDEFRRHALFGARVNYHFTDWFGAGLWGAGGISYNTGLADELQTKAVDNRNCAANPDTLACKRTAVSLCRGSECLGNSQLGSIVWMVAPQATFVPFRGKFSLFGQAFMDADISLFVGPAILGINERAECAKGTCANPAAFALESRVTATATFGLGFNFYPTDYISFGAEFRGTPTTWNTSGFDIAGEAGNTPDDAIDSNDRSFHFNPMVSIFASFQLPTEIEVSD